MDNFLFGSSFGEKPTKKGGYDGEGLQEYYQHTFDDLKEVQQPIKPAIYRP